jgi:hypothetical protein
LSVSPRIWAAISTSRGVEVISLSPPQRVR